MHNVIAKMQMYKWTHGHKYTDTYMYVFVHAKEEIKIKQLAQFIELYLHRMEFFALKRITALKHTCSTWLKQTAGAM